jgi:hypothetical protein
LGQFKFFVNGLLLDYLLKINLQMCADDTLIFGQSLESEVNCEESQDIV